ncbi:hypothetical protein CQA66_09045, partial [Helicobacter aurati]
LQAELQAELQARHKQYEYYRNKLLSKEELEKRARKHYDACQTKSSFCYSTPSPCHSKSPICHSERSEESLKDSNRDVSLAMQAQHDKEGTCHSESSCHSERSEESHNIESQQNTITLTQNQIAFSKYPAFTYILANKNNTTLYIGVTSNLQKRIYEHKNHLIEGFSDKYNCEKLVYFESFENINQAIEREKYLKGKKRNFKENLINSINPKWLDLYDYLFLCQTESSCHSERSEESHLMDSKVRDISVASLPQHDNLSCHSEHCEESLKDSNRDVSLAMQAQHDKKINCHSEGFMPEESHSSCHSEALAEESQNIDSKRYFANAQHDKGEDCHSERSEESKNIKSQNTESQPPELVKMVSLGEVCEKVFAGGTPKTNIKEYWENGTIPWMSSGEVDKNIIFDTNQKITQLGYNKSSTKMIPSHSVVIALAGQGKTRGNVARTRIPLCTNQSLCGIVPNENLNSDFLYFYLKNNYHNLRQISAGDGTRGGLNLSMIKNFQIPLPPLSVQSEIVEILDKFDTLVNDLSMGIPAEIEARRKQYEYYREKLLSFKEKINV